MVYDNLSCTIIFFCVVKILHYPSRLDGWCMDIKISRYRKLNKMLGCKLLEYKVTINGKIINKNNKLDGSRDKFTYRNIIIKVDSDEMDHAETEAAIYAKLSEKDKIYFPKCIKHNTRVGYIIQEKLDLDKENLTQNHARIVRRLIKKYGLTDVDSRIKKPWNWAVNKKTGLPVIYDLSYPS